MAQNVAMDTDMMFAILYIILYASLYFAVCQWAHGPAPHSVCAYITPLLLMAHNVAMDMDMTSTVLHIILYASLYFVICLWPPGPVLIFHVCAHYTTSFDGPQCSHGHGYDVDGTVYHFACVIIFHHMPVGPWSYPAFRVCVHYLSCISWDNSPPLRQFPLTVGPSAAIER